MLYTFLFVGYSRRTSNYLERVKIYNSTHMMSIVNLDVIGVETSSIHNGCSLEKEFTTLIYMDL